MATGIVAVGDSLLDVERSWAWWLSEATSQPLTTLAKSGSTAPEVIAEQLPALAEQHYKLACLAVGGNDVLRDSGFPMQFERDLATIVAALTQSAEEVLVQTLTLGLGQVPGGGGPALRARVVELNRLLQASGAQVVKGSDLRGRLSLDADRLHPTPLGQARLADRAAELLGLPIVPSTLHEVAPASFMPRYLARTALISAKHLRKRRSAAR